MNHTAYLSLGSNLGDRIANLQTCIQLLSRFGSVRKTSSIYETEPMDLREQPWFLNCVVELDTKLTAHELLSATQTIELELGRRRHVSKGPRTIDIDILLFDSEIIDQAGLAIPHPAMHNRGFVLAPLAEIAPDVLHPILQKSAETLLRELPTRAGQVTRLGIK